MYLESKTKILAEEVSMCRCTSSIVASVLVLLCTAMAFAQSPSGPAKPGPEVKKLGVYVGKWTIESNLPPGAMGSKGGKTTGAATCEWVAQGWGVFCRESLPLPGGVGALTDVYMIAYDGEKKSYFFTQVSAGSSNWVGRGTVDGDTWTWTVDSTGNGKPYQVRFTDKFTSPDSFDFKNEIGEGGGAMQVMMSGKQTRARTPAAKR